MPLIFKKCDICGNEVLVFHDSGNNIICCGKPMKVISPNIITGKDPHAPYVYQADEKVLITLKHPNDEEHHIDWIILETNKGFYKKNIVVGELPNALFVLSKDEYVLYTYIYCNIHGLYKD